MIATGTRELDLGSLTLLSGGHADTENGFCIMEAVAFVAGEPWSDSPQCSCPIIAAFLRKWNDDMGDADRQKLKPYIPRLINTRSTKAVEQRRGWMLTDWMIRTHVPAWLELAGLQEQAAALRSFPEIINFDGLKAAPLADAREEAAAARAAARAAAFDAARAAAFDAAFDAASKKLEPTKLSLQASALDLLDRMIACK